MRSERREHWVCSLPAENVKVKKGGGDFSPGIAAAGAHGPHRKESDPERRRTVHHDPSDRNWPIR
jgi:hypothetical protein